MFIDGLDEQCEDLKKKNRWGEFSEIVSFLNTSAQETEIQNPIKDTILRSLKRKVNGSFLWASMMINVIKEAPTVSHILQIVEEGLPDNFETYLQRMISGYPHSNHEFISHVLSCLLHAKRPLLIDELCEATEIYGTKSGENIHPSGRVLRSQLQDSLGPLIRVENITATSKEQICSLSHAAVKKLLESKPDILSQKAACQISPNILAQGCLKYLQQPRYKQLLKVGTQTITTECGSSIENHALLEYAAKTCLQVQSLSFGRNTTPSNLLRMLADVVLGQFHIRHTNRGNDQEIQLFKSFPKWLVREHADGLRRQNEYNDAIIEWSHVLSNHSTCHGIFKGEVSRCLWSTLGSMNFLNKFPTTFKCFILEKARSEGPEQAELIFDRASLDGLEVDLMRLEKPIPRENGLQLKIERWAIKRGSSRPKRTGTRILTVDKKDLQLYYGKLIKGVPERAPMVESTRDGGLLRIGSRLYSGVPGGQPCFRMIHQSDDIPAYIETIACDKTYYAVACRGRISVKDLSDEDVFPLGAPSQITRQPTLRDERSKEDSDFDSDCSSSSASTHDAAVSPTTSLQKHRLSSDSETHAPEFDAESIDLHSCISGESEEESSDWSDTTSSTHSAELSWSEGSTAFQSDEAQEPMRGFEDGFDSGSDNELNDVDSVDQKFLASDKSVSEDALDKISESVSSLTSVKTLDMIANCDVESESSDDSDDSNSSIESGIAGSSSSEGNEDVQVSRRRLESILGNRRNGHKGPLCEVLVFRLNATKDDERQHLFHFRQRMSCRLYASPPIFHPTHELLVWPLGDCKILFADFIHKKYFIRTISKSKPKGCQVSVQCNFSPCGQYLHVASLQGVKMRFTGGESRLGLRLIVSTHRLSKRKLVRSPPRMVYQTSVKLAKDFFEEEKLDVMNMPTVLTWGVNYLYVAEKSLELLVHRLPLFKDVERKDRTPDSPRGVVRNMGSLFLPRSAESRKVHFFVARDDGDGPEAATKEGGKVTQKHTASSSKDRYTAHVLLGAQNEGGTPEWVRGASRIVFAPKMAPQGVHLTQEQLGGWSGDTRGQDVMTDQNLDHGKGREVTSMLERFEAMEDFEFVPYLHH
ncbi:hypothetical protein K456DRAFT_1755103 [Colletotrichum gloeosporioides 23]|nr:hypothetical protein K456DRAFT_1755103 [Colletotrichum gloeosporioides 23]